MTGPSIDIHIFKRILDQTLHGAILTNKDKQIIYVNPAFTFTTGYTLDEVYGRNPSILQSGRHDRAFYRDLWRTIRATGQWQGEIWNKCKDGSIITEWQNIFSISSEAGEITHYAALFSDITERTRSLLSLIEQNKQLQALAYTDEITGTYNRRYFNTLIAETFTQSQNTHEPLSLLMIDVDYFKSYNDTYGHLKGDQCLKRLSYIIQGQLTNNEQTLSRYGGEEFVLLLPRTSLEEAKKMAELLLSSVQFFAIPNEQSEHGIVTISIGCATNKAADSHPYQLISRADKALYEAKSAGRNCVFSSN
jgi:diguanylate cyclase (GGDEF)-like protein/PAS domain S-box-containing protein